MAGIFDDYQGLTPEQLRRMGIPVAEPNPVREPLNLGLNPDTGVQQPEVGLGDFELDARARATQAAMRKRQAANAGNPYPDGPTPDPSFTEPTLGNIEPEARQQQAQEAMQNRRTTARPTTVPQEAPSISEAFNQTAAGKVFNALPTTSQAGNALLSTMPGVTTPDGRKGTPADLDPHLSPPGVEPTISPKSIREGLGNIVGGLVKRLPNGQIVSNAEYEKFQQLNKQPGEQHPDLIKEKIKQKLIEKQAGVTNKGTSIPTPTARPTQPQDPAPTAPTAPTSPTAPTAPNQQGAGKPGFLSRMMSGALSVAPDMRRMASHEVGSGMQEAASDRSKADLIQEYKRSDLSAMRGLLERKFGPETAKTMIANSDKEWVTSLVSDVLKPKDIDEVMIGNKLFKKLPTKNQPGIYVDENGRNQVMNLDEFSRLSDRKVAPGQAKMSTQGRADLAMADKGLSLLEDDSSSALFYDTTGPLSLLTRQIPGTDAATLGEMIKSITGREAIEKAVDMRREAGASVLGQITATEFDALGSVEVALSQNSNPAEIARGLRMYKAWREMAETGLTNDSIGRSWTEGGPVITEEEVIADKRRIFAKHGINYDDMSVLPGWGLGEKRGGTAGGHGWEVVTGQ